MTSYLTMALFILMIYLYTKSPEIPENILKIEIEQTFFELTSIAIMSIIMVLYNLFAWVSFE